LTNYDIVLPSKVWIGFLFSLPVMMATEGSLFARARVGAGLGPPKGSVFGGLHVLLLKFSSSLAHQKVVEGVS